MLVCAPEREMDGATDFLVIEHLARPALNTMVRPHPELTKNAGTGVHVQDLREELPILLSVGIDDDTILEPQANREFLSTRASPPRTRRLR